MVKVPYTSTFYKVSDRRGEGHHYDYKDNETGAQIDIWVPETDPDKAKEAIDKILAGATRLNQFK